MIYFTRERNKVLGIKMDFLLLFGFGFGRRRLATIDLLFGLTGRCCGGLVRAPIGSQQSTGVDRQGRCLLGSGAHQAVAYYAA